MVIVSQACIDIETVVKIPISPQVCGRQERGSGESHVGEVWRPPSNFREIQGGLEAPHFISVRFKIGG